MPRKKKEENYISFYERKVKDEKVIKTDLIGKKSFYFGFVSRLIVLSTLSILCILSSLVGLKNSIKFSDTKIYKYNEDGKLNYYVYLKPNSYYETNFLEANMNYLASIIDYIKINFNYQLVGTERSDIKYSYYIDGILNIYDTKNANKILFTKKYDLLSVKENSVKDKQLAEIKEELDIDYAYYNDLAKSFKRDFNVSATSDLTLNLHIISEISGIKKEIETSKNGLSMVIPLTEQTINIKMNSDKINKNKSIVQKGKPVITNSFLITLSIMASILAIVLIVELLRVIIKSFGRKNAYDKKLNQILKDYDRAIVTTNTGVMIDEKDNIIELNTFEELLDLRDIVNIPIIFIEIHRGQKSWFVIKKDNVVYRYVLKLADFEKKK